MIQVFIEVAGGSRERGRYDEQTLQYQGSRPVSLPYPYPYGFIVGTCADDGESVDCYILTPEPYSAGVIVECEPIGMLEQDEDGEMDYKVLAVLPGQKAVIDQGLLDTLRDFIYGIFAHHPEMHVRVGDIFPRQAALDYIQKYRGACLPEKAPFNPIR